jgi:polyhydroxyalkanoate synthesis regulator phasin
MAESLSKFYQLKDDDLTAANEFRDQVKFLFGEGLSDDETIAAIKARRWDQNQSNRFVMAIKETLSQGKLSDDEAIAKIKELSEQSQLLGEITDILNRANTECLDHRRFKQEEKIVLTGFRGLCDIHAALFKKRSEYEIYGSRIINDLLNSVELQAQKQAYDQEEIDILEMSVNANEIREKEFDVLLEEVTKLKSDLRIAKKVIARLVGE